MKRLRRVTLFWLLVMFATSLVGSKQEAPGAEVPDAPHQWPHWRGPLANGLAPNADPPTEWSETKNVRWKVSIPGEGKSTPIIWNDRIYLLSAIATERTADEPPVAKEGAFTQPPKNFHQFMVYCLDRGTGGVVWSRMAIEAVPHEGRHTTNSFASGSPTTDGQRLYASFGSRGIYAYSLDGNLIWSRDLGRMYTRRGWGESVTPVVHGETLIVNWDQEENSSLVALNANTGETRWQVPRDEATTWTTALIVPHKDRVQVIVNGANRVRSYDLENGEPIWECGGQTVNPIPSPVAADGVVYCVSGYRGAAAVAIPLDSKGDVTDSSTLIWKYNDSTPYVPSPIIHEDQIYFTRANSGILTSLQRNDGTLIYGPERLSGIENIYASPIIASGRLYIVSREGATAVLKTGRKPEVLATNTLNEPIDASPAAIGKQLFLRSDKSLYCLEAFEP